MNIDWKKIIVSVLSVLIMALGGSHYQQSLSLNEVQNTVKDLEQAVKSISHRDVARFESE